MSSAAQRPLWRDPDFARLWGAQAVSSFGARITREGLPMTAILVLNAPPAVLGLMASLSYGPALVVGLLGGGFVDRRRRRPILIAADLARALVLITVPIAAWMGILSLPHVLVAAALVGAASVLFDMADHAYLPDLVGPERVLEGNARLSATESVAELGGPALAGMLFQWLSAPVAIAVNAVTYLASALVLGGIRRPETASHETAPDHPLADVAAGLRIAWETPHVRTLLVTGAVSGLFGGIFAALYLLFALKVLGLTPALLGITVAFGGAGALAGAALAGRLAKALGVGPGILVSGFGGALGAALIPLAPASPGWGMAVLIASQLLGDSSAVAGQVLASSLRQSALPTHALGRVGGAFQAAAGGAMLLGALAGGALGAVIGVREALAIAAAGLFAAPLIALASGLGRLKVLPVSDGSESTG